MEVDDREELRLLGILYHSANTIETRAAHHANKKPKQLQGEKLTTTAKIYLTHHGLILRILLFTEAQIDYPKELCALILSFVEHFPGHLNLLTKEILIEALRFETSKETLFRSDNAATAFLASILNRYAKAVVAKDVIKPVLAIMKKLRKKHNANVFSVIEGDDPEKLFLNIQCLSKVIRIFFESLFTVEWPKEVKIAISHAYTHTELAFPGAGYSIIGSVVFLRFICAILVRPDLHNITSKSSASESEDLVLLSKVIHNIVNNIEFGDKESYMSVLNVVVRKYTQQCNSHLTQLVKNAISFVSHNEPEWAASLEGPLPLERSNPGVLSQISTLCDVYGIVVYQQIILSGNQKLAQEFKQLCELPVQQFIQELESVSIPISISVRGIQLLDDVCVFLNNEAPISSLKQQSIAITQKCCECNYFANLGVILRLHSMSIESLSEDLLSFFVSYQSLHGNLILFPNFAEKLQLFQQAMQNTSESNRDKFQKALQFMGSLDNKASPLASPKIEASSSQQSSNDYTPASNATVRSWTTTDVIAAMENWHLPKYIIELLVPKHCPNGEALLRFDTSRESLRDIGIQTIGVRKLLQRNVKILQETAIVTQPSAPPATLSPRSLSGPSLAFPTNIRSSWHPSQSRTSNPSLANSGGHHSGSQILMTIERTVSSPDTVHLPSWSTADVAAWLRSTEFAKYSSLFENANIDGAALQKLTTKDLADMGISLIGHRKAICRAIASIPTSITKYRPYNSSVGATGSRRSQETPPPTIRKRSISQPKLDAC